MPSYDRALYALMEMAPTDVAARLVVKGRELAFCCERCLRAFLDASQWLENDRPG